ncbi:glycosyl hydrolase family 3 N terminal domain-containing protein [Aspergillus similis]
MYASGALLPYQNATIPVEDRVDDLIARMTVDEKASLLFHDIIFMGNDGALAPAVAQFDMLSNAQLIHEKKMSHFNLLGPIKDARAAAKWYNNIQREARKTRLGIPVTISTDPRNHFTDNVGTGFEAGVFSQWPESLGLAALRSADLVEQFANIARQEASMARIGAAFGEDASLTAELVAAYIRGFQRGNTLGSQSVSTMTKHFPGGGPQKDGEDPHFAYGREQVYPGNNFDYHLLPFKVAIAAGAAQIMPYYGMPVGTSYEEVGFAFNEPLIKGLLREELGFEGIICTDWGLVTDKRIMGQPMPARAWGLEHLSRSERIQRILEAGCDQLGGESCPELLSDLVAAGHITEDRLDISVRRLLREKFLLGLFDDPFVDEEAAARIVGNAEFCQLGADAQRRSYTLLTNVGECLPLRAPLPVKTKLYVEGIPAETMEARGLQLVDDPADAQIALLRLKAPYEPRPGAFEALFHAGSLEYSAEEKARQAKICATVPTVIVDIYADRPPVVPELLQQATAVFLSYGSSSDAFLDVVFGVYEPEGKLPFDLPSSMNAVQESRSDMPYDTRDPLFRFGHGLRYSS